jgi:hypothetical protein
MCSVMLIATKTFAAANGGRKLAEGRRFQDAAAGNVYFAYTTAYAAEAHVAGSSCCVLQAHGLVLAGAFVLRDVADVMLDHPSTNAARLRLMSDSEDAIVQIVLRWVISYGSSCTQTPIIAKQWGHLLEHECSYYPCRGLHTHVLHASAAASHQSGLW